MEVIKEIFLIIMALTVGWYLGYFYKEIVEPILIERRNKRLKKKYKDKTFSGVQSCTFTHDGRIIHDNPSFVHMEDYVQNAYSRPGVILTYSKDMPEEKRQEIVQTVLEILNEHYGYVKIEVENEDKETYK